jgi:nitrogen fixation/metabolism regulation signal transduction histidine kinase
MALVVLGALPAVGVSTALLWMTPLAPELRWGLLALILGAGMAAASSARALTGRSLNLVAHLLGALREGDYSIRGRTVRGVGGMAMVMREVNDLGATLQRHRTEALESRTLLSHVMEEIGVAVFAFDPAHRLLLVNRAGAQLLEQPAEALVGRSAQAIGFAEYLSGDPRRLIERSFAGRLRRYEVRRAQFYRDGRPHHLIVMTDLSQALREQEQAAWQRIVRVLSHEINNSLTPIKSIAHSLGRTLDRGGTPELRQGLALIEERSGALGRFLRAYAQVAQLPAPRVAMIPIAPLVARAVELDRRVPVVVTDSPDISVLADSDQLEQLLINVLRNAADASSETGGAVNVSWDQLGPWFELTIEDEGRGLPDSTNLFVPFFTTKPRGSGIGLALSRQIAEAHNGMLTLENRTDRPGCRAVLRLPARDTRQSDAPASVLGASSLDASRRGSAAEER